jgi:hypothetical protein
MFNNFGHFQYATAHALLSPKKNPLANQGVRWSGKRDLKDLHGE